MVILVKPEQFSNAKSPIEVTESGIIMLVKFAQPLNALLLISTTGISSISAGISIFVTDSLQSIIAI